MARRLVRARPGVGWCHFRATTDENLAVLGERRRYSADPLPAPTRKRPRAEAVPSQFASRGSWVRVPSSPRSRLAPRRRLVEAVLWPSERHTASPRDVPYSNSTQLEMDLIGPDGAPLADGPTRFARRARGARPEHGSRAVSAQHVRFFCAR